MCWVVGIDYYNEVSAVNLTNMSCIDVGENYVRFTAERQTDLKKTPELMSQLISAIPGLAVGQHTVPESQPVVPAEPEEPFRITGLGLYEMRSGEQQRIERRDPQGIEPVWFGSRKGWYFTDGRWNVNNPANDIVKLIKLDEVQP